MAGPNVIRGRASVFTYDSLNGASLVRADVPADEMILLGGGGAPRPLGKRTSLALTGDRLFVGTGDSAVVLAFRLDGTPAPSVRVDATRRAPSQAEYEKAVDHFLWQVPSEVRSAVRERLIRLPRPEVAAPYRSILGDPHDLLWIVLDRQEPAAIHLRAFDLGGTAVADVRIPASITVYEIGSDYVLGGYEDDEGEVNVAVFKLHRGPVPPRPR